MTVDAKMPQMPGMDQTDLRPSWRLINTPNNKKSQTRPRQKKILIDDDRSHYVCENKQDYDIMPSEMSYI